MAFLKSVDTEVAKEILKGILKITTAFSNNPGEFISNIKSGKIDTPPKRTTRTVKKPVRKTINKK